MTVVIKIVLFGLDKNPMVSTAIANRLVGIENSFFSDEIVYSPLRILEMSQNGFNIQIWDVNKFDSALPKIYTFETNGLIIVSKKSPAYFLGKYLAQFEKIDFQILWYCSDENNKNMSHSHLGLDVHQINFNSLSDEAVILEFNNWLKKLLANFKQVDEKTIPL